MTIAPTNPIRVIPPLTISERSALQGAEILEEIFAEVQQDGTYKR